MSTSRSTGGTFATPNSFLMPSSVLSDNREEGWPGDNNPSANDAADAYSTANEGSMMSFRNAVMVESQQRRQTASATDAVVKVILDKAHDLGPYLTLALAAMGSLLRGDPVPASSQYWHDAIQLMAGQIEVGNREARSFNLLKAWVLLETYAVLSNDSLVWKRANMPHGYVESSKPTS
ncbi:hypothetical protein SCUCBS95973_001192 [Sporothrix curviconia]|uniref:C6 zinc finger domain containing protein n=1 Tax=Sporothrix curviconia TaxID=1260050 RepID=A0ABP0AWM5_9PEZI